MRYDSIGLFWEDTPTTNKLGGKESIRGARPLAPIRDTGWKAPTEFPNLFNEKILGFDLETYDPELTVNGPGWARGVGHIVGVSVSTKTQAWYFPMRHEVRPEENMDPDLVLRYLKDLMQKPMPKVGANVIYDRGWLQHEGVKTNGICYDVLYAEAILDDVAYDYSLEAVSRKYLGEGKVTEDLYEWCHLSYGGPKSPKQRANIYRAPPCIVGPYAEGDALQPLQILLKQREELVKGGFWDLFELECKLIPVLIGMRFRGLPVNVERATQVSEELKAKEAEELNALTELAGFAVNVNASNSIQKLFDKFNLGYPKTKHGNASFTKQFLAAHTHPAARRIIDIRKLNKVRSAFVESAILDKQINGKLYPSFHPLRGESGGAGSGRYSSSQPNGQQMPKRDKYLGPLTRSIFVPEEGFPNWIKFDFSQIEYRLFAHESNDARLIAEYQDPDTDYHDIVSSFLEHLLIREIVKNFNFMSLYGGGVDRTEVMLAESLTTEDMVKMLDNFSLPFTESNMVRVLAKHFTDLYSTKFPAARKTLERFSNIAATTGEIRTILNRRSTFNLWEPANKRNQQPLRLNAALSKYGRNIKRAYTYRGLNRRLQGSAADMLKKGMLDAYEAGLFNEDKLGFPHVTVHDEFDFSFHPDLMRYAVDLKTIMEHALPLKVPVIMDMEIGTHWGNVEEVDKKLIQEFL